MSNNQRNEGIETKCLHSGYTPKNGEPRVVPIVQSTTYCFDSTEHIAGLFDMPTEPLYSRFANPTCDAVEKKRCRIRGGAAAMLTSSGQAASSFRYLIFAMRAIALLRHQRYMEEPSIYLLLH